MKTHTPADLLSDQLLDISSVEAQLVDALPILTEMTSNSELRWLIEQQADQVQVQKNLVAKILSSRGVEPNADKCKAIAGLLKGGKAHLDAVDKPNVRDLMMIAHCVRIGHYEIAAYEITLRLANNLSSNEEEKILAMILDQKHCFVRNLLMLEKTIFLSAMDKPKYEPVRSSIRIIPQTLRNYMRRQPNIVQVNAEPQHT